MPVKLREIAESIEMSGNYGHAYYSKKDEEVFFIPENTLSGHIEEFDELLEDIDMDPDNYLILPDQFEVDGYRIMEDFIFDHTEGKVQEKLYRAIHRRKPFRNFKDTAYDLDVLDKWYEYKDKRYREYAKEWCEENSVEFEE